MSPGYEFITVGDMVNRILDLEQALQDVMDLIHELSGPDSEKYEVIQRAHRILKEGIK
jgi:GAF domain-containing protein